MTVVDDPIPLQPTHWWYVAAVVLALLIVGAIMTLPTAYNEYRVARDGPRLRRCFGFEASDVEMPQWGPGSMAHTITAVHADSVFARAGVRPGDMPAGYQHGLSGFYADLQSALDGEEVTFSVANRLDLAKGRDGWREIRVGPVGPDCR